MGAPKQKWTSEEEVALKAGVSKYGAGKWSMILKDPEFKSILHMRSNVDLKDKWRNVNAAAGLVSRQRTRPAVKSNQQTPNNESNLRGPCTENVGAMVVFNANQLGISSPTSRNAGSRKPITRLDDLILEAIRSMKEPRGSNQTAIAMYIEENYLAPPNLERLLAANLKLLMENKKLIKVKHQYRIAPPSTSGGDSPPLLPEEKQKNSPKRQKEIRPLSDVIRASSPVLMEGKKKNLPKIPKETKLLTKSQIEVELEKMRSMTAREVAAAAAQAVADAEAAIAEAEEAAREAEAAEAEAEAAQVFAEAAMKALKCGMLMA